MSVEELTKIAKERYETGAHGGTHLRMGAAARARLFAEYPPSGSPPWDPPGSLSRLIPIPVVADDSLPVDVWQLVDNATETVLRTGEVPHGE
jgi:hypothetical protein